jgi:Protein of unknown function (DUF1003)
LPSSGHWILWNLGWRGLPPFDSSFVLFALVESVEAIFMSTFVLISQSCAAEQADERASGGSVPRTAEGYVGDEEVADEETRVLEFQRRLDKARTRGWDDAYVLTLDTLRW